MKKILLMMLCALPCLVSAQNLSRRVTNEKSLLGEMIKNQSSENRVFVYSDSENNLPDSVYTYYGEHKLLISKAALTYDDNGRRLQEKGVNYGWYLQEISIRDKYKKDYTYTQKTDSLLEEIVYSTQSGESILGDDDWIPGDKELNIYNANEIMIGRYMYDYDWDAKSWKLDYLNMATEFNEKGNPVIVVVSTMSSEGVLEETIRRETSYNGLDQIVKVVVYKPIEGESEVVTYSWKENWKASQKLEIGYTEKGQRMEDTYYRYDDDMNTWRYGGFAVKYEYDERRDLVSMFESWEDFDFIEETHYAYVYSSEDSNDLIPEVRSAVYPNPVSDVLNVTINGADNAMITLSNAAGSVVAQLKTTDAVVSIPVRSLAQGYYFLTVWTAQGVTTHKVIIR